LGGSGLLGLRGIGWLSFRGVTWGAAWWFIARERSVRQSRRYASGWIIPAVALGFFISGNRGWMQWPSFFLEHLYPRPPSNISNSAFFVRLPSFSVTAAAITGDNVTFRRLRVINFGTRTPPVLDGDDAPSNTTYEGFPLRIEGRTVNQSTGIRMEHCVRFLMTRAGSAT
jgi:hypothetical protein